MIPLFIKSLKAPEARTHTPTVKVSKDEGQPEAPGAAAGKAPGMEHFSHLLGLLADRKPGGDFGPHNVEAGHHVAFSAGAYTGAGKVAATGRDGLTVEDDKRREHRVHWREITGHFAPEKSEEKPKAEIGKKPRDKNAA